MITWRKLVFGVYILAIDLRGLFVCVLARGKSGSSHIGWEFCIFSQQAHCKYFHDRLQVMIIDEPYWLTDEF